MSDLAIEICGLAKRYQIGARESYATLRDTVADRFSGLWRSLRSPRKKAARDAEDEILWALRDVNLSVREGEVLGLIGRNGAGKSTLLKILSRITLPTEGYADISGRVRSLLEVGTGFHPELTGRENIYLNGAILGMKRGEIQRKFDEIVAFAEVERFVDTPVKRYSSGMYLRLAFAVAAHLTAEILLVDEVLAVGDAAFQKKCLGRMGEVAHEGRTVIFVSHNIAAIRSLCTHGVVLEQGKVAYQGDVECALFYYVQSLAASDNASSRSAFSAIRINGQNPGQIASGDDFEIGCTVHVRSQMAGFRLFCILEDANGSPMIVAPVSHRELPLNEPGGHEIKVRFPALWLRPGIYSVHFKLLANTAGSDSARFLSESVMLDVSGTGDPEMLLGCLAPPAEWYAGQAIAVTR